MNAKKLNKEILSMSEPKDPNQETVTMAELEKHQPSVEKMKTASDEETTDTEPQEQVNEDSAGAKGNDVVVEEGPCEANEVQTVKNKKKMTKNEMNQAPKKGSGKKAERYPTASPTFLSFIPCPQPPACLYNQRGKMCSILGERCIVTQVYSSPVFVGIKVEQCEWGPVGVDLVWFGDHPLTLDQVQDGAEVCFDAVVIPGTAKFVALVVWQDTKPSISNEPYFNSYVVIQEFENIMVSFVSYEGDCGFVRATIENKEQLVWFSNSVMFKNGQKVERKEDIDEMCGSGCGELFANVYMLVTVDSSDKTSYQYGFMCSCLWSEMKPQNTGITSRFDKFTLYQKVGSSYSDGKEQLYMHCDAQSELVLSDSGCKLTYKNNNQEIIDILCEEESFYCGNQRVSPVSGGQVKAHLRRTVHKNGKEVWTPLIIQLTPNLVDNTTNNQRVLRKIKPRQILENGSSNAGKENYPEDEGKDAVSHKASRAIAARNKAFSLSVQNTPKVYKGIYGTLYWEHYARMFVIATRFKKLPHVVTVGKRAMIVEDGLLKEVVEKNVHFSVQFDVYLGIMTNIVAIWKGTKPLEAYNKSKSNKYYYDVPGVFHGMTNNNQMMFDITIGDNSRSITVEHTKAMYTSEGQRCHSIPVSSQVTLHLKESCTIEGQTTATSTAAAIEGQTTTTSTAAAIEGQTAAISTASAIEGQTTAISTAAAIEGQTTTTSTAAAAAIEGQTAAISSAAAIEGQTAAISSAAAIEGQTTATGTAATAATTSTDATTATNPPWLAFLVVVDTKEKESSEGKHSDCIKVGLESLTLEEKVPEVAKNCRGILFYHYERRKFVIATRSLFVPSKVMVGARALYMEKGTVFEARKNERLSVLFDVHVEYEFKCHVVAIWRGSKPTTAYNDSRKKKFYYDYPGIYRGISDNKLMFDIKVKGAAKSITTEKIKAVCNAEGQICDSIPVSSWVSLHLKESCDKQGESQWDALLVVILDQKAAINSHAILSESEGHIKEGGEGEESKSSESECRIKTDGEVEKHTISELFPTTNTDGHGEHCTTSELFPLPKTDGEATEHQAFSTLDFPINLDF